jgi:hypothetical protein
MFLLPLLSLGSDTTGSYVQTITGTANQITVTGGTGESSTPTLSIPTQFTIPQDATVTRDLQVTRNLNVNGNITIGGTSATIFASELKVADPDLVLGIRTDGSGNDVSNDTTANHGGIAIASTEGSPLVQLFIAGIETTPATYKKIMWFKAGSFAGLGTDAWLSNYAVGIGSTQFPVGTRLAAGDVQFTERDLAVVRNINASGVVTATTFSGNLANTLTLNTSGTGLSGSATFNNSGASTFTVTSNATSANTGGAIVSRDALGGFVAGIVTATTFNGQVNAGVGTITTLSGTTATYTTGNITNISGTNLNYTGISTLGVTSTTNLTAQQVNVSGITTTNSLNIGATQVISSARQLQNIASLDATTTATIESAIANAPNTFTDLQVTGISTFTNGPVLIGSATSTGTASQRLQVTGGAYVSGNLGIGTTNPTSTLTNFGSFATGLTANTLFVTNDSDGIVRMGPTIIGTPTGTGRLNIQDRTGSFINFYNGTTLVGRFTSPNNSDLPLEVGGSERLRILGASGNIGIGTTNPQYNLHVIGSFAATTKSFVIDHPTKPGKKLRYASLEGPENAIYVRGRTQDPIIELPDYWTGLVDENSITVNLTPIGESATPRVKEVVDNQVLVFSKEEGELDYYYTVYAERKDVEKLEVEI